MSRSPKRERLHAKQQQTGKAQEGSNAALAELQKAQDRREHAQSLKRGEEAKLAALDDKERSLVAETLSLQTPSPEQREERRLVQDNLAAHDRASAVLDQDVEEKRKLYEAAAIEVRRLADEAVPLIDAVLAEEGDAAIAALFKARAEVVRLEAAASSIAKALTARKAYRHAEVVNIAVNTMGWPKAQPNPKPYLDLAERLAVDPDAVVS
jgi:phosphoglycolate phosphatase-like HAD superfamily hydrolase